MKTYKNLSPLRYPGGKSRLSQTITELIQVNKLEGCTLYELYAGGAGASINLLVSGVCERIILNDFDFHIFAFWFSVLNQTQNFIDLVLGTEINIDTWHIQKEIYENFEAYDILQIGFSAFFLNRTNRSGIINKAGPIGGRDQSGRYKMDVRFNKKNLIKRIEFIAQFRNQIEIHQEEAIKFLELIFINQLEDRFIFLDPPYYEQGKNLYLNFYTDSDHVSLSNMLKENNNDHWILTYDNRERINSLYHKFRKYNYDMKYSLQDKKESKELMIFSDNLTLPTKYSQLLERSN